MNIGSGPAIGVDAWVTPRSAIGDPLPGYDDEHGAQGMGGIAVNDVVELSFYLPLLTGLTTFDLRLSFYDVAGKAWEVRARF
jgi:hypothetical protein